MRQGRAQDWDWGGGSKMEYRDDSDEDTDIFELASNSHISALEFEITCSNVDSKNTFELTLSYRPLLISF